MEQHIREYKMEDEDAVRQLYWEAAQQHRNQYIINTLLQRQSVRRTWQAGLVGLLSLHLATTKGTGGRALLMLELALWSCGVGMGWYMWIRNEWENQIKKHSIWMAERLQHIQQNDTKNNAWVMEVDQVEGEEKEKDGKKKNKLIGAVALEYQQEEHEGRIQNLTGVESRIELALVRTVIQFARDHGIKVIATCRNDAKWSECCFSSVHS